MRNECNIIRDLLPLYLEHMVSEDSEEFVKEHLEKCAECRQECEQMKEPQTSQTDQAKEEGAPLIKLKQKMRKKRMQTVLCTGLFVIALLVSAFAALSAPVYFPYEEDLFTITENADESITITFDEKVTDYRCEVSVYSDSENAPDEEGALYYEVEAWTSLWDEWFSKRGVQSITIRGEENRPFAVYFVSNNSTENICVYGQPITSGGVVTLPGHVLSYYFLLALLCIIVLFVIWCIVRRKPAIKVWVERIMLYPVSYIIGSLIVLRGDSRSYSALRDFMLIVFISILVYGGLLLAQSIYRVRKEIREMNE